MKQQIVDAWTEAKAAYAAARAERKHETLRLQAAQLGVDQRWVCAKIVYHTAREDFNAMVGENAECARIAREA